MYQYNTDQELRDSFLNTPKWKAEFDSDYIGGIRHFSKMTYSTLLFMVANGFADPNEYQNCSPTTQDFLEFLQLHPNFTVMGYVVHSDRDDYRLSVDGLEGERLSYQDIVDFANFAHGADEFEIRKDDTARAWWD